MLYDSLAVALQFLKDHPTWYIFPIKRLEKAPPCFDDNLTLASNNPLQIRKWHALYHGCNWGLSLKKSDAVVLDVDTKPGKTGQTTLDNLEVEHGDLPPTLTVETPSGGFHYYFNGAHKFGLGKYLFGKDLDSPNYVLLPGCWICTKEYTRGYVVIKDEPVADAPEWFGQLHKAREAEKAERAAASNGEPEVDLDKDENIAWAINYLTTTAPNCIQGRNGEKALLDIAAILKDRSISEYKAVELLTKYYNVVADELNPAAHPYCEPLWSVGEGADADRLDIKVGNAYRYLKENVIGAATAEYAFGGTDTVTDDEIADVAKLRKSHAARERRRARDQMKAREEELFTETARGQELDPLTGEPYSDDDPDKPSNQKKADAPGEAADAASNDDIKGGDKTLEWLAKNWVWVVGLERFIRVTDSTMWTRSQFDSKFNHMTVKTSMSGALFKVEGRIKRFDTAVFRPGMPMVLDLGQAFNLWRQSPILPDPGNTDLWNEHLNYLFQNIDDRDHVLNWMAWVYQNQRLKPNHALLIVGKNTGTGKSFLARVLEQLIGKGNTQRPKNSSLKGDFNGWAQRCKLCIIEELMQIGRREVANELRDIITEPTIEVNIKNVPAQLYENYMAMMGISNHPDALPIDETDRRWLVVSTPVSRRDPEYYDRLFKILDDPKALAAIAYELETRELGEYTAVVSAPFTTAKQEMIELSRSDVETWLHENLNNHPLNCNLVAVQDVVDNMPSALQKSARLSASVVPNFLRDKARGEKIGSYRLSDRRRASLWCLHGRATMVQNLPPLEVAALYENERKAGFKSAEEEAGEDFGV